MKGLLITLSPSKSSLVVKQVKRIISINPDLFKEIIRLILKEVL